MKSRPQTSAKKDMNTQNRSTSQDNKQSKLRSITYENNEHEKNFIKKSYHHKFERDGEQRCREGSVSGKAQNAYLARWCHKSDPSLSATCVKFRRKNAKV